jgi:hypothetical protein
VIASNLPARLPACLHALEPQLDEWVEVLVHEAEESSPDLRARFGWARFEASPGVLVPELWRDGFRRASGDVVAFTVSQMVPEPDWISTIRCLSRDHDAFGGAIEPGSDLRLADWGEYFCRYARHTRPFQARVNSDLPGDNAVFSRQRLEQVASTLETGYWEAIAHPALQQRGATLWQSPELAVRMGRSGGFKKFAAQRLEHGRRYGQHRGTRSSLARNLLGVAAAPAVPILLTLRVVRSTFATGRLRARVLLALPAVLAYNSIWAFAEARGHLDALRR